MRDMESGMVCRMVIPNTFVDLECCKDDSDAWETKSCDGCLESTPLAALGPHETTWRNRDHDSDFEDSLCDPQKWLHVIGHDSDFEDSGCKPRESFFIPDHEGNFEDEYSGK